MSEAALLQKKNASGVSLKKAEPQKQNVPPVLTQVAKKRVLVIGLGDNHHRIKNKLSETSFFEDSRRKALALLRERMHEIDIVVALPHNLGGIDIEDQVWATGFTGQLIIATDGRNVRKSYAGKGHLVMVNEMPEKVAKKLKKK